MVSSSVRAGPTLTVLLTRSGAGRSGGFALVDEEQVAVGIGDGHEVADGRLVRLGHELDAMLPEARVAYLAQRARIGESNDSPWPELLRKEMQFEYAFAKAGGVLLAGLDPTGYGGVVAGFGDQRL